MHTTTDKLAGPQLKAALALVHAAFPDYRGRKVRVSVSDRDMQLLSYWDSGHRDYWTAVQLSSGRAIAVPQNGTPFDRFGAKGISYQPIPGIAIVQRTYSGSNQYCYIHLHPANAGNKLITMQGV